MLKRFCQPLLLVFIISFCAACLPLKSSGSGGGPVSDPRSGGPDSLLTSAESAYSQGQYRTAADYYKQYLQQSPNPANLESILLSYGLASEKSGQFQDAASAYERLTGQFAGAESAREGQARLAGVYMAQGQAAKAGQLAEAALTGEADAARQSRLRLVLGQSQWAQGRYAMAGGNFITAWRGLKGGAKAAAEEGVLASLARMEPDVVRQIQKQYGQNFPGPEATYLLVYQAAKDGNKEDTAALAAYFARYFGSNSLMGEVNTLAQAVGDGSPIPALAFGTKYDPRVSMTSVLAEQAAPAIVGGGGAAVAGAGLSTIGNVGIAVILPLTGDGASQYAQEILAGLKLAVSTQAPGGSIGLTVLDTRGSAEEAARLVAQAAADPKVLAVVGPFLSRESAQAAQSANRAGLPIIAISQRPDLPKIGPNVFRLFLTPKHQAEAVARYSVLHLGHKELGIFYPESSYGRPMRTYFENEVNRLGASLTVARGYDPQTADWAEFVAAVTGKKASRKVSSNYQAETGFTALYMPDSVSVVSQIMSQLAFHDVTKMQYLGASGWYNQELISGSRNYVQGAAIPVALTDLSQRAESKRFIADYAAAHGQAPDQFAAYGYDAGLALIAALSRGGDSRQSLRQALSSLGPVPGATGPFSFDQNGEYAVEPTMISVKGQSFTLLRDAGPGLR